MHLEPTVGAPRSPEHTGPPALAGAHNQKPEHPDFLSLQLSSFAHLLPRVGNWRAPRAGSRASKRALQSCHQLCGLAFLCGTAAPWGLDGLTTPWQLRTEPASPRAAHPPPPPPAQGSLTNQFSATLLSSTVTNRPGRKGLSYHDLRRYKNHRACLFGNSLTRNLSFDLCLETFVS